MHEGHIVTLSKRAQKDQMEFTDPQRKKIAAMLLRMETDPFYPPCEKLTMNLSGKYSRRISIHDRMVFEIREAPGYKGEVYVLRLKGHYKEVHSLLMLRMAQLLQPY